VLELAREPVLEAPEPVLVERAQAPELELAREPERAPELAAELVLERAQELAARAELGPEQVLEAVHRAASS